MTIKQAKIPRSVEIIKSQLHDLAEVMASVDYDKIVKSDTATQFFLESMQSHEDELKEELKAAEWMKKNFDIE
jgi:hypothetical protein